MILCFKQQGKLKTLIITNITGFIISIVSEYYRYLISVAFSFCPPRKNPGSPKQEDLTKKHRIPIAIDNVYILKLLQGTRADSDKNKVTTSIGKLYLSTKFAP
jgi:hypothetical protein